MNKNHKLLCFILSLIIAAVSVLPAAAYGEYADSIIGYNLKKSSANSVQEWIDGELTQNAGSGSEWYIIALSNCGEYSFSAYGDALSDYLAENEVGSASSRLKYALTFVAIGDKSNPYIAKTLGNSIGEQGIMSLVFGLHLLNNGCISEKYSQSELINEILSLQLTDGGWAIMGENGDVDATAMAIQALAPHYDSASSVKTAVDKALAFLSERQNDDGSYSSYGVSNPESISQVIIALTSLGIDSEADDRFIKNGNTLFDAAERFRLSDGSYCHKSGGESNSTATVQVLCASIAYENFRKGEAAFYDFGESKAVTVTEAETVTLAPTLAETTLISESKTEKASEAVSKETAPSVTEKEQSESEFRQTEKKDFTPLIVAATVLIIAVCLFFYLKGKKKTALAVTVILVSLTVIAFALSIFFSVDKSESAGTVTISVRCDTVKDSGKKHIPSDGIIIKETEVEISEGDTVYDVLSEICKEENIIFSANMGYIEGINNLFETDFGDSSGWIYFVNGESPSVGCDGYVLSDGDKIQWCYTRNLGKDLDIDIIK